MIRSLSWSVLLGACVACGGASTQADEAAEATFRRVTPLATSESQQDCFDRVKRSVLDGALAIEDYEATLGAECGAPTVSESKGDPSPSEPTPTAAPEDPAQIECFNAVKAQAIAEGWSGETYEAELTARCETPTAGGG